MANVLSVPITYEMLHVVTELGDLDMAKHFSVNLPSGTTSDDTSARIRDWLNRDCKN